MLRQGKKFPQQLDWQQDVFLHLLGSLWNDLLQHLFS
jgi:hypothetical protein